jgi:hypothetical protein
MVLAIGCDATGRDDLHPLDQMSITFDGSPSRADIQSVLDPVMQAYSTPVTEDNYSRAGSVLVKLKQDVGIPEMEVLDCMSRQRGRWGPRGFAEGAGYAAFTIQTVGNCNPAAAGT